MTAFYVYPWKWDCDNAHMLRTALGGQLIKLVDSKYKHAPGRVIVNWGNSKCPYTERVINPPWAIKQAVNKNISFDLLRNAGVPTISITRNPEVAQRWINNGNAVVGRSRLTGNNGAGITIYKPGDKVRSDEKLYTRYENGTEYRVNVYVDKQGNYQEISIRTKHKDGIENDPFPIRSGANDYFFRPANHIADHARVELLNIAGNATKALDLSFSGVDIISNDRGLFVIEVNTAPELRGNAVNRLATLIKNDYDN